MPSRGINRKTIQYILIGVFVVGIAYLLLHGVKEGFQTDTVELFHRVPASGATPADKKFFIPKDIIIAKERKKLNSIKLQRFDKNTQQYMNVDMNNVASTKDTYPGFKLLSGGKTKLFNSNYTRSLLGTQSRLPLSTNDPALAGGIELINLDSNMLGITTDNFALDSNQKNLKIILEFVN